jgi:hypothetical protein
MINLAFARQRGRAERSAVGASGAGASASRSALLELQEVRLEVQDSTAAAKGQVGFSSSGKRGRPWNRSLPRARKAYSLRCSLLSGERAVRRVLRGNSTEWHSREADGS